MLLNSVNASFCMLEREGFKCHGEPTTTVSSARGESCHALQALTPLTSSVSHDACVNDVNCRTCWWKSTYACWGSRGKSIKLNKGHIFLCDLLRLRQENICSTHRVVSFQFVVGVVDRDRTQRPPVLHMGKSSHRKLINKQARDVFGRISTCEPLVYKSTLLYVK